jgi:nucleoside-diphosphate-sugar epimerase
MGRVFVTGGAGFVGAGIVRQLLARGHQVAALSRGEAPRLQGLGDGLTLLRGDLRDLDALRPALQAFGPDSLIHAAWQGVLGDTRQDPSQARNVDLAVALMGLAADLKLRRCIGIGSQAEYGPKASAPPEDTDPAPNSQYGAAKVAAHRAMAALAEKQGMGLAWMRLYAAYGPGNDPRWMLETVIRCLLRGERPRLTAGEQRLDYLYIDDLGQAVARVLEQGCQGVFNLASGQAPTMRSTVETLRDLIDPSLPLGLGDQPYAPGPLPHLEADIGKLRSSTGWEPAMPLREGLARTIDAVRRGAAA